MRLNGVWFLGLGWEAPEILTDVGTPKSMRYTSSMSEDDSASAIFAAPPIEALDREDLRPEAEITLFFGLNVATESVQMVIDDVVPNFSPGGTSLEIVMRDPGSNMKGWRRDQIWSEPDDIATVLQTLAEFHKFDIEIQDLPIVEFDRHQNESDWSYMRRITNAAGARFWVHGKKIHIRREPDRALQHVFTWGAGNAFIRFGPRTDRQGQRGAMWSVEGQGYDELDDVPINAAVGAAGNTAANVTTDKRVRLSETMIRVDRNTLDRVEVKAEKVHVDSASKAEVEAAADAEREARLRNAQEADFECLPIPERRAGDVIELRGIGALYSGLWRVNEVTHSIGQGYKMTQRINRETVGVKEAGANIAKVDQARSEEEAAEDERVVVDRNTLEVR